MDNFVKLDLSLLSNIRCRFDHSVFVEVDDSTRVKLKFNLTDAQEDEFYDFVRKNYPEYLNFERGIIKNRFGYGIVGHKMEIDIFVNKD